MELLQDIKEKGLTAVNSYEKRVNAVAALIRETAGLMEENARELETMTETLRDMLAAAGSLRKKDFNCFMENITSRSKALERDVKSSLHEFWNSEGTLVETLRRVVTQGAADVLREVKIELLPRQRKREEALARLLLNVQTEQDVLKTAFQALLRKGESIRVKDFKTMVRAIEIKHGIENRDMERYLVELDRTGRDVTEGWMGIISMYEGSDKAVSSEKTIT